MSCAEKVSHLERHLHSEFNFTPTLFPYIQLHEFEALLFSHPVGFQSYLDPTKGNIQGLLQVINDFENPELINSSKATSPSHRIQNHYPPYKKPLIGNLILLEIGFERVQERCPRFRNWVNEIINKKAMVENLN